MVEGGLEATGRRAVFGQMWSCLHIFVSAVLSAKSVLQSFVVGLGRLRSCWALHPQSFLPA